MSGAVEGVENYSHRNLSLGRAEGRFPTSRCCAASFVFTRDFIPAAVGWFAFYLLALFQLNDFYLRFFFVVFCNCILRLSGHIHGTHI